MTDQEKNCPTVYFGFMFGYSKCVCCIRMFSLVNVANFIILLPRLSVRLLGTIFANLKFVIIRPVILR